MLQPLKSIKLCTPFTCLAIYFASATLKFTVPFLQVLPKVVEGVLELMRRLRRGDAADTARLAAMVTMLRELRLYDSALLQPLLADTTEHYRHEGAPRLLLK